MWKQGSGRPVTPAVLTEQGGMAKRIDAEGCLAGASTLFEWDMDRFSEMGRL